MAERKGQVFVDDLSEQLSCTYNGFCGASEQEVGVHVTCRFRVDSSIILKFIALRVEMVLFLKFTRVSILFSRLFDLEAIVPSLP